MVKLLLCITIINSYLAQSTFWQCFHEDYFKGIDFYVLSLLIQNVDFCLSNIIQIRPDIRN